ncbi:uncharacterized protein LOC133314108 [Gastrolobium bilobum]|uniref:uncharacterized protein LOC133314108 n=1 Tax=Gastrolobium bilobum TaxID=150636 RepID=UPI002AAF73E5|nr:uncharacterized protein LOC133314108 [Gastrolobium bilobum]
MGLLAKAKPNANTTNNNNTHNSGMGFLLVFFREDNNTTIANKTNLLPLPSSSSSSFKRTNSITLFSKAQSTISICVFFLFITLLLFTLSTFEPTTNTLHRRHPITPKPKTHLWLPHNALNGDRFPPTALQRMGTLYRRGNRAMNDLVVSHVVEDTTHEEFRLFLRVLHRSGITSKSDVVFLFASPFMMSRFANIVREENDSFLSLVQLHFQSQLNSTRWSKETELMFDVTRFTGATKKRVEMGEPVWGKRIRRNSSGLEAGEGELTRMSYGSVLSFDANELDPENSLAGFLDRVPLGLRRWACYPMLLGRVRRSFKHVMLVDVKNLVIFNDPLERVRNRSPESVLFYQKVSTESSRGKHGKKNSVITQSQYRVNSAVVMGGARGVRRLSNAMLVEIVRASMQHKKKNSVSESAILSQLVRNEFLLKSVDLITLSESIPDTSSLAATNSAGSTLFSDFLMIQRGMGNYDLNSVIKKQICSSVVDSFVYRDC